MPCLPIAIMLSGLNHLTLAVADLPLSVDFYVRVLGLRLRAQWDQGAYLALGDLWLCLSSDKQRSQARSADYTHYAFTLAQQDFAHFVEHARSCGVREWKSNRSGGDSFYFLDPDGPPARSPCRLAGKPPGAMPLAALCRHAVFRLTTPQAQRFPLPSPPHCPPSHHSALPRACAA